ncbi:MAG: NADH-quinone oxidoreductase subunit NuoE [Candidatus Heimdallarchaeota archaeon]|nr:NADH-quinone oxidoreductase subunit NuoE [Candidatus Heimdallarchaeota archaeon]
MTSDSLKIIHHDFKLSDNVIKKIHKILAKHEKDPRNIIQILQDIQAEFHYLAEPVISFIAKELAISEHRIYGVATFYSQFKFVKPGKHQIRVCMGTACHVRGAQSLLDKICRELHIQPGETTKDGLFSIESVYCLGCCALAPVMVIDDNVFGNMSAAKVTKILRKYRRANVPRKTPAKGGGK